MTELFKWIKAEDYLPENEGFCNDEVLFCTNTKIVFSGGYDFEHGWYARGFDLKEFKDTVVTHWMPMPKPPGV